MLPFTLVGSLPTILLFILVVSRTLGATLIENDVHTLLALSRPLHLHVPEDLSAEDDTAGFDQEFSFIHPLILAVLLSLIPNASRVKRLLRQDWAVQCRGWQRAGQVTDESHEDGIAQEKAVEVVQDFCRISLQNVGWPEC